MKKVLVSSLALFTMAYIFIIKDTSYAATVGNPIDLDLPATSSILRQEVVNNTLDEYEQIVKIKTALDLEFLFNKDLDSSSEVSKAELSGKWCMVKLGTTIFNRVEPYIKIGTSNLTAEWRQNSTFDIKLESDWGFAWGGGVKGVIWEFKDYGMRLTGDIQYRTTQPDVKSITKSGAKITDSGADFDIEEWQASIVLSKKFELPLKLQSLYIVPYTGAAISDSSNDVKFTDPADPEQNLTLYDASNKNVFGFVLGCDIMPSLTSSFIYNLELRLANEIALTLGGAMKF